MTALFAMQLALPLTMILWLALAAPHSAVGFWIQLIGSAAGLWAIALLGIWLLPPWWAPYGFGVALAVAAWVAMRRRRPFASAWPATWLAWVVSVLFLAIGVASAYGVGIALRSNIAPPVTAVNLAFPLAPGSYLIVNGGSGISSNLHLMTLDARVPRFQAWRGQSYGVDIIQIDAFGLRAHGVQPVDPRAYRIYGTRVLAPCAGHVVLALDGLPDMPVPKVDRDHMAGNHVLLRCAKRNVNIETDVLLGHLRPGSLQVHAGAIVAVGDWLGSVGNSGNTGEPHLHVHAQRPGPANAPFAGDPLPILFGGRYPVRGDRFESL